MRFKVPQNIEMEDRIFGPLTLIQFVYLMSGGLIIYITFSIFNSTVFFIIAVPVAILSLALAFLKIQDQPFAHFLVSLALYVVRPRQRVWQKNTDFEISPVQKMAEKKEEKEKSHKEKTLEKANLEQLAYILDTKGLGKEEGKSNAAAKGAQTT